MGKRGASARLRGAGGILALVLAGLAAPAGAACTPDTVEFAGPAGPLGRFRVEVADTPDERAKGLMFRERMAKSAGMLFVYDAPQHATFWMKNTLIPLDMIFVDGTGRVTRVHPDAVPQDTTVIDGGEGVRFVVEINAGLAARMGIVEGSVMRAAEVPQDGAAWPCDAGQ